MAFANISLNKSDFKESNWQKIIEGCEEKECSTYSGLLFGKAREAEAAGDQRLEELFTLLGAVTSFMLKSDSKDEPFAPVAVLRNSRSAISDDLQDVHLDALKEIVAEIKDPEMRARVADVLWVTRRDFHMGELAVEAYLESAKTLEHPENWPSCAERIERATRIAVFLGAKNKSFSSAFAHIEAVLDKYDGQDPLFLSARMMELLLEFDQGDPAKYIVLAEKLATRAESERNWHKARTYWGIKAGWHQRQNDSEGRRNALINAAETYVGEVESALKRSAPSYLVASTHLQSAIEAHRRIGGNKARVDELHKVLLQYQAQSVKELKPISVKLEVTEEIKQAIEQAVESVKGKDFHGALFDLALMLRLPKVEYLKQQAIKSATDHPLQHLFSAMSLDRQGKVIGRKPPTLSTDPEEIEAATRSEMFRQAEFHETIDVQWTLEPVRQQIVIEHPCRLKDFLPIVSNNPFVPEGREDLYAQGLQAGLKGDLPIAMHLLIPQFEHSVRYVLAQRGVITSGFDQEGIQEEYNLNKILYLPILKETFGDDTIFHLQRLLVEPLGANLRNRMAHGLMSYNDFYSLQCVYLWWLILKLLCIPIIAHLRQEEGTKESEVDSSGPQKAGPDQAIGQPNNSGSSRKDEPES